jgi:cytochrome c553
MRITKIIVTAGVALGLSVSLTNAKTYSTAEVYEEACVHCHGKNAEGNPEKKGPALNTMSQNELAYELFNLTTNGSQSSGSDHEIMEHNQDQIEDKGLTYHPDDMARFIYTTFNPEAATLVDENGVRKYSTSQVYDQMCALCHGKNAEGNPEKKGPALNDYTLHELEMELISLDSDGFQSSGRHSDLMRENLKRIEKKGMSYHPEDMATYIYYNYNPDAKK